MNDHVIIMTETSYCFKHHQLASIHRLLRNIEISTLVFAFVLSRIDYCNSLLFDSTHDVTSHLQQIKNYAARVILRIPKSSNLTAHLRSLHWLPVKVRSTYKIACLCYHYHSSAAPSYVADMMQKKPSHTCNTHTTCLFPIDLHTVRQHLVMLIFFCFCLELCSK